MSSELPLLVRLAVLALAVLVSIAASRFLFRGRVLKAVLPVLRRIFRFERARRVARGFFALHRMSRRDATIWYAALAVVVAPVAWSWLDLAWPVVATLVLLPVPLLLMRHAPVSAGVVLPAGVALCFIVSVLWELSFPVDRRADFIERRARVEGRSLAAAEVEGFAVDEPRSGRLERYLADAERRGRVRLVDDFEDGDVSDWIPVASFEDPVGEHALRGEAMPPLAGSANVSARFAPSPNARVQPLATHGLDGAETGHHLDVTADVERYTDYRATHGAFLSLVDAERPFDLDGVTGVLLRARGTGAASLLLSFDPVHGSEHAPYAVAYLPLTAEWRTFYIPLELFQIGIKREFQAATYDGRRLAGVWLLDAGHWSFGAELLEARFQIDDLALLYEDPVESGALEQGEDFAGLVVPDGPASPRDPLAYRSFGVAFHDGEWENAGHLSSRSLAADDTLTLEGTLTVRSAALAEHLDAIDHLEILVLMERFHAADGRFLRAENLGMSTQLTVTGAPIQNMNWHAQSLRERDRSREVTGEVFHPVPRSGIRRVGDRVHVPYRIEVPLRGELPAGLYRPRIHVFTHLTKEARRTIDNREIVTLIDLMTAPGYLAKALDGAAVNGTGFLSAKLNRFYLPAVRVGDPAPPRMVWSLFGRYVSNGTRGVVADEDRGHFQFASRNIFQTRMVLERTDRAGTPIAYSLEPDFPVVMQDRIAVLDGILHLQHPDDREGVTLFPLDYDSGRVHVRVEGPDGERYDLGSHPFTGPSFTGATTGAPELEFRFPRDGEWTVRMSGFVDDVFGNRYEGGGTYRFFVGHRITFSTSVKPGTGFYVGEPYPTVVEVHPPLPGRVRIEVDHYPMSDPARHQHHVIDGTANRHGYFFQSKDTPVIRFDEPGEYTSEIVVRYRDERDRLWVGAQRSYGVVSPPSSESRLVVRGGRIATTGYGGLGYQEHRRVRLAREGFFQRYWDDESYSINLTSPFYSGDVLYVGTDLSGMNLLRSRHSVELSRNPFERALNWLMSHSDLGFVAHLSREMHGMRSSTGRDPFAYPEERSVDLHYYASAIRPGFTPTASVSDGSLVFDYWETNPNDFGGQVNAGVNGDMPGDMYKFFGGAARLEPGTDVADYGNYASTVVVLPRGSNGNRVVAPLEEPLFEVNGRAYTNLFGVAVGAIVDVGDRWALGGTALPTVAGRCSFEVVHPDGRHELREGRANETGRCSAAEPLLEVDAPGRWQIRAQICQGFPEVCGEPIGTPDGWYDLYVVPRTGSPDISFDVPPISTVPPAAERWEIPGRIPPGTRGRLHYTVMMPGIHMDRGELDVDEDGRFTFELVPDWYAIQFPNFDVVDHFHGGRQLSDTVVVSFFFEGEDAAGEPVYASRRLHFRGSTLYALPVPPPSADA